MNENCNGSLSGHWVLNKQSTGSQKDLLRKMKRKWWEILAIDLTNEELEIVFTPDGVRKVSRVYLNSPVGRFPIPYSEVKVVDELKNGHQSHQGDQKRFLSYQTRTICKSESEITILWELPNQKMISEYFLIEPNILHLRITVDNYQKTKCFTRTNPK